MPSRFQECGPVSERRIPGQGAGPQRFLVFALETALRAGFAGVFFFAGAFFFADAPFFAEGAPFFAEGAPFFAEGAPFFAEGAFFAAWSLLTCFSRDAAYPSR